ncbi:MAG: hypothetical protein L0170_02010 [Acidobacteria bacterium]|nr:hypothetical protein [Acidobacteriota bacterium]
MTRHPVHSPARAARPRGRSHHDILLAASVLILLLTSALIVPAGVTAENTAAESRLLRFPALSKDSIAFVNGGDIWIAPRTGGLARQLTSDPGLEWFPRFSPDGKWIAFIGQYDGNRDVYLIPSEGGVPKRLTWWIDTGSPSERQGPNNLVLGWTPTGSECSSVRGISAGRIGQDGCSP